MKKNTQFAPAQRASASSIKKDFNILNDSQYIKTVIDAIPEVVAILNEQRQIVFGNEALLKFLGIVDKETLLGLRPGEAVHCINSGLTEGGCGTSEKCRYCGAVNSILESQRLQQSVTKECRITANKNGKSEFLDLRVTSSPFKFGDYSFSILSIDDISDAKRRRMLEKIFFHDVINIAGGLKGITDILITAQSHHETEEYIKLVNKMGNELLEEIMSQRALSFAETGELQPIVTQVSSSQILKETSYYLSHHTIAQFKKIIVAPDATNIIILTAEVLLKRVLINMLKNALEACNPGDEIKLDCKVEGDEVIFKVHNDGFMPEQVQAQIFQRSFSTHGQGRGLGTYSIKLLTEHYLNGSVGFSSTKDHGTEFYIKIPKK